MSHPVGIVTPMRISTLFRKTTTATSDPSGRLSGQRECCREGLAHCHGTLVLHADGTVECDDEATCGADELQHELWMACDELGCGCAGDDAPLDGWARAALGARSSLLAA